MITREELIHEVQGWAKEIGVHPKEIHLRKMKRKWASCSSKGRLTFALDILQQSKTTRKEIILHELLHLKYPNHGRMFRVMLKHFLEI